MAAEDLDGGPPPSTLAAQLVENISTSARSSRSDENSELRGLFAIIQRVKDDPTILKSLEDRVGHNHMLTYVYCRVVLAGLKLDDPRVTRDHIRTEVVKALNFLRFTIKETPSVLLHASDQHGFMFRGTQPLWVWLLPQLFVLLGHHKCAVLTDPIEGFVQYVMLTICRTPILWRLMTPLLQYLKAALTGTSR